MTLDVPAARRYGKQIALPDVGSDGQERLLAAEVALAGTDLTIETSARYLGGAGVGRFRVIAADGDGRRVREAAEAVGARASALPWPENGEGWNGRCAAPRWSCDRDSTTMPWCAPPSAWGYPSW